MTTYKIGTRGSLLAVTQSTLIKEECERISGEKFELVTIKTQGDEITNKPLWQLEGKDFFTKELDEALLNGEVDFVVHSYKDLGSVRPQGIKLAAVTERTFPHDILLVPQKIIDNLHSFKGKFKVGTSSPRRIANLTHSLKDYLPHSPEIECSMLRGNVNTRIRKLKEGEYHAITLALAGIERLAHKENSAAELKDLLSGMNYFILPQSVFPSAASQGALGIEMRQEREDDGKLLSILSKLSHKKTTEEVERERMSFKEFGGGCHLAVGIHVRKLNEDMFLHINAGEVDQKRIEKKWIEGVTYPVFEKNKWLFVGLPSVSEPCVLGDQYIKKIPAAKSVELTHKHVFVTSKHCLLSLENSASPEGIWAAGAKTARELAAKGFWVNGSADSLGIEDLKALRSSKALTMIHRNLKASWIVLTHSSSVSELGATVGCYERTFAEISNDFENKLKEVAACYWTSFPQYTDYLERFPFLKEKYHFCGLGKTWQEFASKDIPVYPVSSMNEFYQLRGN